MEKTLYNQVGEVKGKEGKEQDSFSFQFIPQNENLKRTRGALFTLVTVTGESENKYEKAKSFYHSFQSSYYAKASGSIINGLSETLDQVEKEIVKNEEGNKLEIALVAAVFWGSVVYLAKFGKSAVFVARSGKLKKLEFSKVASGVLEDQDMVCLGSEGFADNVPVEELGEFLNKDKFEDILGGIDKKIADKENSTCVVIRLSVNAPDEEPENLAIGEVDEKGKTEFPEKSEEPENKMSEQKEGESLEELPVAKESSPRVGMIKNSVKNLGGKIASGFQFVTAKILKPWKKATPGELVDHVAVRRARSLQVVALVIIILIASITIGTISSGKSKTNSQISSLLTDAQNNLSEAQNIQTIDPVRAKTLVEKATKSAQEASKMGSKDPKIKKIESDAAGLLAEITRSYPIEQLTEVFNFSSLDASAKVNKLAILSGQVGATDSKNNNVYSVNVDTKEGKKIDGSFNSPDNIAAYSSGFYVQTKDGVSKIDNSGKVSSVAKNTGWGTIVGAATNKTNNLYLLDKGKNEIWRYFSTSSGLSSAQAYTSGDKPDLTSSVAVAIDDYVWVATQNGNVYKISQGVKQDFTFSNMTDSFGQITSFFTSSNTKNHYILDQGKGRVVISDKTGVYGSQYSNSKLHNATSLVVNEESKTVYFTDGEKLYSFKIR